MFYILIMLVYGTKTVYEVFPEDSAKLDVFAC